MRIALGKLEHDLAAAFKAGDDRLACSKVWGQLRDEQRATLATSCQLKPPATEAIGTDDEILAALHTGTLGRPAQPF